AIAVMRSMLMVLALVSGRICRLPAGAVRSVRSELRQEAEHGHPSDHPKDDRDTDVAGHHFPASLLSKALKPSTAAPMRRKVTMNTAPTVAIAMDNSRWSLIARFRR